MHQIKSIAVIGLGYVGLPLALLAEKKEFTVFGLDIDQKKIAALNNGESYIDDVKKSEIEKSNIIFSEDFSHVSTVDAIIICVPTPVSHLKEPDLGPVKGAITKIAEFLKDGALVVVESTINPGVCDEVVIPLLESLTQKKVGKDISVAHCPERINPGDTNWHVGNINRVLGANSQAELDLALGLYEKLIDAEIKPMKTIKEAEAVKIVENSFRDVNIAFVNELAMSFHKLGINVENVIDGAATKPFAFMPHRPGCGVGGHCIPVDPYYMIEYAHSYGFEHDFLRLARNINERMPKFTVEILGEALNNIQQPLKGTRVALLGLSYKADVGDARESPAYAIKKLLDEAEVELVVYDPYIKKDSTHDSLNEALSTVDAIIIATGHTMFKEELTSQLLKESKIKVVIDGRNILKEMKQEFEDAVIIYHGIGV